MENNSKKMFSKYIKDIFHIINEYRHGVKIWFHGLFIVTLALIFGLNFYFINKDQKNNNSKSSSSSSNNSSYYTTPKHKNRYIYIAIPIYVSAILFFIAGFVNIFTKTLKIDRIKKSIADGNISTGENIEIPNPAGIEYYELVELIGYYLIFSLLLFNAMINIKRRFFNLKRFEDYIGYNNIIISIIGFFLHVFIDQRKNNKEIHLAVNKVGILRYQLHFTDILEKIMNNVTINFKKKNEESELIKLLKTLKKSIEEHISDLGDQIKPQTLERLAGLKKLDGSKNLIKMVQESTRNINS